MTILNTTSGGHVVMCDAVDCDNEQDAAGVSSSFVAWCAAEDDGWRNRNIDGRALDLCPYHAARPVYLIA